MIAPSPARASRQPGPRAWWKLAVGAAAVLALCGVAVFPVARWMAESRARAAGVSLTRFSLSLGWGEVVLRDVQLTLTSVRGVRADVDSIRVSLSGLTPSRVTVGTVTVSAEGSTVDVVSDLVGWAASRRGDGAPVSIARLGGTLRDGARGTTTASVEGLVVTPFQGGGAARNGTARLEGVAAPVAIPTVAWLSSGDVLTVGLGRDNPVGAPVRAEITTRPGTSTRSVHLVLARTSASELTWLTGASGPLARATIEATADMDVPASGPISGKLEVIAHGASLPVPREVSSVVAGAITLTSALTIDAERTGGRLTDLRVTAGTLRLAGNGTLVRGADRSTLSAQLAGTLPCSALAGAAVGGPGIVGGILAEVARGAVSGDVTIRVAVDADTHGPRFSVRPTVSPGCGLRL